MLRARWMAILLTALLGRVAAPTAAVDYAFRFMPQPDGRPVLDVRLTFRGDASGRTVLVVPSNWAGQDSLRNAITRIEVDAPAAIAADSGGILIVRHTPNASVAIHYRLREDWNGPIRYPLYHRAIIDSNHVVLNTQNALIYPKLPDETNLQASFSWASLPADWLVVTSYGTARETKARTTERDLINASFAAGHFRAPGGVRAGNGLTVVTEGTWRFPDTAYVRLQQEVWRRERAFWKDDPFAHGFVVLIPAIQRGTVGGTAFTSGFVEFADTAADLAVVVRIATHEMLHFWNGARMATPEPEGRYKWFTEGFTDYYADRFLRDAGGSTDSALLAQVNRALRDYYMSPVAGSKRSDVETRYWTDADMKLFPYRQGYTLALYLESELKRISAGRFNFDSLMLRTYRAARKARAPLTDSLMLASLPVTLHDVVATAVATYIDRGERIPDAPAALGTCVGVVPVEMDRFDLGFDATASVRDKIVHGVIPGGSAALAGLQDGMHLSGWGWYNGDPTREATFTVTENGAARKLHYLPRSGKSITVPQFRRDPATVNCHVE